jgi:hypothetical protein
VEAKLPTGATVAPVIISTDKTRLTNLSGDQTAWPVYLTLGNISKALRRQPSSHSTILIGYLPVFKMDHILEKDRSVEIYRLFHHSMHRILQPMEESGRRGIDVVCGDGVARSVFPILASYMADYPEQCLVACCKENRCPLCTVQPNERGDTGHVTVALRQPISTLLALRGHEAGDSVATETFEAEGLRRIYNPFWANLPHCDIFSSITPDILHQLHKGLFHSHLLDWCTSLIGEDELDARFKAMPGHPGLRHFKHGISGISQWTGKEFKAMEKVFLGAIAGAMDKRVVIVARSVLDFIYYAQLQSHSTQTIAALQRSLADFHANKSILIDLGIRRHFNIPKIHIVSHYVDSIFSRGSLDAYNTEASERLHIDYAKDAYRSSNRRDYTVQMTRWLQRREAMYMRAGFIHWCEQNASVHVDQDAGEVSDSDTEHDRGYKPSTASISPDRDGYYIAKKPPFPGLHPAEIERVYNIAGFLTALTSFIRTRDNRLSVFPAAHDRFDCFNQVNILLPAQPWVASSPQLTKAIIRATPSRPSNNQRTPEMRPARFDAAFVLEDPATDMFPNPPVRIARIRVIFRLPPHLALLPHPLAFVEWYTHLGSVDPTTQMYHVSRATRNRQPHSAVVSVTQILRGCHLIPQFPRNMNSEWTQQNSMELAARCFVNTYVDLSTFVASKGI